MVVISTTSFPGKPTAEENLASARELLEEAGRRGTDIVCLPESFTHRRQEVVQSLEGSAISMVRELARRHSMYVIAPIMEAADDGIFNTAVLVDRRGEILGIYRKVYLTPGERAQGIRPGQELPVFETDFARIAILTCYDHEWPEIFGAYRRLGAQVVFWPTMAYGYAEFDHLVLKSTICFDHGLYLVSANYYYGSHPAPAQDFRHTYILSPEGVPLADSSYRPGLITTHVDLNFQWPAQDHSRAEPQAWTSLLEYGRRPDLYTPLLDPGPYLDGTPEAQEARDIRVAALNLPEVIQPEPEKALARIDTLLAESRAQIAVLPENCLFGGAAEEATPPPVPATASQIDALAGIARRHSLYLAASMYEEQAGDLYAMALLFTPDGDLCGRYRKTHLSRLEREHHGVGRESDLLVFPTELGTIGLLLGRDIFYPEAHAVLALRGADLILWGGSPYPLYPNGWQMRHLLMARPVAHGTCLAAAMYSPSPPHLSRQLQRSACIVDQYGQVRAETGARPGIATAILSLPPEPIGPVQRLRSRLRDRPHMVAAAWLET